MTDLLTSLLLGGAVSLKNRIVMAPMTRTRTSPGDVPNALMATYYGLRASAGLIISEAIDVAPSSKGYAWTPGIYTDAQRKGWSQVTEEVHRKGGTIFAQLWHVGRMAHPSIMPGGQAPWGVTAQRAENSDVFAHDENGVLGYTRAGAPRQLATEEVSSLVKTFAQALADLRAAGFDGVELHAANGYLFEQFMNPVLNTRTDQYGGRTLEDRTRFLMDVVDAGVREFGPGRVGVRFSPFGRFNSMPADPDVEGTLLYVARELGQRGVGYLHLIYELMPTDNMETAEFEARYLDHKLLAKVRSTFPGAIIWCGGFNSREGAEAALKTGLVDLIAFGRPFIGNPDLVQRLKNGWPLAVADRSTYYTRRDEVGFTDFGPYCGT